MIQGARSDRLETQRAINCAINCKSCGVWIVFFCLLCLWILVLVQWYLEQLSSKLFRIDQEEKIKNEIKFCACGYFLLITASRYKNTHVLDKVLYSYIPIQSQLKITSRRLFIFLIFKKKDQYQNIIKIIPFIRISVLVYDRRRAFLFVSCYGWHQLLLSVTFLLSQCIASRLH